MERNAAAAARAARPPSASKWRRTCSSGRTRSWRAQRLRDLLHRADRIHVAEAADHGGVSQRRRMGRRQFRHRSRRASALRRLRRRSDAAAGRAPGRRAAEPQPLARRQPRPLRAPPLRLHRRPRRASCATRTATPACCGAGSAVSPQAAFRLRRSLAPPRAVSQPRAALWLLVRWSMRRGRCL